MLVCAAAQMYDASSVVEEYKNKIEVVNLENW